MSVKKTPQSLLVKRSHPEGDLDILDKHQLRVLQCQIHNLTDQADEVVGQMKSHLEQMQQAASSGLTTQDVLDAWSLLLEKTTKLHRVEMQALYLNMHAAQAGETQAQEQLAAEQAARAASETALRTQLQQAQEQLAAEQAAKAASKHKLKCVQQKYQAEQLQLDRARQLIMEQQKEVDAAEEAKVKAEERLADEKTLHAYHMKATKDATIEMQDKLAEQVVKQRSIQATLEALQFAVSGSRDVTTQLSQILQNF
jgi:hypothetical protein